MDEPRMAEGGFRWSEHFPQARILRSFSLALQTEKVLFGTAAVVAIYLWGSILDALWTIRESGTAVFSTYFASFALVPMLSEHLTYSLIFFAGALPILAMTIAPLCRIASLQIARNEKINIAEALSFARRKILHFILAPALPLVIILMVGLALFMGGFLLAFVLNFIFGIGNVVATVFMGLAMVGGLIAALCLVAGVAGLPLMYPTIAVEGSDCFDAVSRSFSYVFGRPWQAVFSGAVAAIYGAVCLYLVYIIIYLTVWFTQAFATAGSDALVSDSRTEGGMRYWQEPRLDWTNPLSSQLWVPLPREAELTIDRLIQLSPPPPATTQPAAQTQPTTIAPAAATDTPMSAESKMLLFKDLTTLEKAGYGILWFWVHLILAVFAGMVLSYVTCASSHIYLLLRREVDATDYDDIFVEDYEDEELAASPPAEAAPAAPAATVQLNVPAKPPEPPGSAGSTPPAEGTPAPEPGPDDKGPKA